MWEKILAFLNMFRPNPAPVVAVLQFSGIIAPQGRGRKSLNLDATESLIATAFSLKGVKAVALSINSPGGSPVQSALILDRIRYWAKEKDIPVFAFCEDIAASGGYMLALGADEIYAHEASIIGSIGVVFSGFGFTEALKKLGIERRLYTVGDNKGMLDPFSPERQEDVARLKSLQTEIHEFFKQKVTDRRGKRLKGAKSKIFTGDVWLGAEAKKMGLIDDIGEMRSFLIDRFGKRLRIRTIKPKKEGLGLLSLLRGMGGDTKSINIETPTVCNSWSDDILETIEARQHWDKWGL